MFDTISALLTISVMNPDWIKIPPEQFMLTVIILFFSTLLLLEISQMRHGPSRPKQLQSYRTNIVTFIFNDVAMSILSISSLLLLAEKYNHIGLMAGYSLSFKTLISFIVLDLILYLWHKANHQYEWLWMFHKVHHSDQSMNVSTSFRVHFTDLIFTTLIKALFIIIMGVDVAIVAFSEAVTTLFTMFHHSKLLFRGERWLKWLFIVPALHRVHHSAERREHDSNYGAILSIWDRMFGTLFELNPKKIGLKNVNTQNFFQLLKYGFAPANSEQHFPQTTNIDVMIAEAAYYKAEKRGFAPGWELQDWLDAKEETMNSFLLG